MKAAQAVLLALIAAALWLSSRHRARQEARAFRRLAFIGLGAVTVLAVLLPSELTRVANRIGIGRGADLVLYLVAIGLLFFALNTYLKFGDMDRRLTLLVRELALLEDQASSRDREQREHRD
jgi:hypothetical protein